MKLKYEEDPFWAFIGLVLISLGVFIAAQPNLYLGIAVTGLGVFLSYLHKLTYIALDEDKLILRDRWFLLKNKNIKYEDILYSEVKDNKLILYLKNDEVHTINYKKINEYNYSQIHLFLSNQGVEFQEN